MTNHRQESVHTDVANGEGLLHRNAKLGVKHALGRSHKTTPDLHA